MNEIERNSFTLLWNRVEKLEKRITDLEVQVQGQQKSINTDEIAQVISELLSDQLMNSNPY